MHYQDSPDENQKFKKINIIVSIVASALIVAGLGFAGYYYKDQVFSSKTETDSMDTASTTSEATDDSEVNSSTSSMKEVDQAMDKSPNNKQVDGPVLSVGELIEKELQRFDNITSDNGKQPFDFFSFKTEFEVNPQMITIDSPKDGHIISEKEGYLEVRGSYDAGKKEFEFSDYPYFAYISLKDASKVKSRQELLRESYDGEDSLNDVLLSLGTTNFENDPGFAQINFIQGLHLSFDSPILVFQVRDRYEDEIVARKIISLSKEVKKESDIQYKSMSVPELNIIYQAPEASRQYVPDQRERDYGIYHWTEFEDAYSNHITINFNDESVLSSRITADEGRTIINEANEAFLEAGIIAEEDIDKMLAEYEQALAAESTVDYLINNDKITFRIESDFSSKFDSVIEWRLFPINNNSEKNFYISIRFNRKGIETEYFKNIIKRIINSIEFTVSSDSNENNNENDSDNDGLSDYDEINVYGTDPYNPDTDGDGYSDKEEVDSGHDPLK